MAKRTIVRNRIPPKRTAPKVLVTRKMGSINKQFIKTNSNVQDVRQKLISKKRNTIVDARDILAKVAKTGDARDKLNKIRQTRGGVPPAGNIKVIGSSILQKVDSNGKISLITNKLKSSTELNVAIQKELGLIASPKRVIMRRPVNVQTPIVRQPVVNEYEAPTIRDFQPKLYKWSRPSRTTASELIGSLETRQRVPKPSILQQNWQNFNVRKTLRMPQSYVDLVDIDDEEMPLAPSMHQTIALQGSSRISNIHSRLDSHPSIEPETHGILSQTKTKVVVPAGHRIVVSNLQSTVTQDDVKELFEDIGQLLAARLVRPGIAEVIYKNLKDAQKAVDTYHNRQLDGQPMKCLLVNKRPLNNPTAPPLTKMDSHGLLSHSEASSSNSSNKLVPDLSTIHKVLFQRK